MPGGPPEPADRVSPPEPTRSDVSDQPMGAPGGAQQPSEEEVQAYISQLREAPVEQVVAEVLSALLNAAQVKMGRADGRLLLDLAAVTVDSARDQLAAELTDQIDEVLAQLRVAQVEAEKELAGEAPAATDGAADAASPPAGGTATPPGSDPASRLWVPGS